MNAQNKSSAYKYAEEPKISRDYLKVISDKAKEESIELKLDHEALDGQSKVELISTHFEIQTK